MSMEDARSSARGFRVHTFEAVGATVVECFGRLTYENAPSLKEEVKPLIPQRKRIVLDLQGVPQIDSSGLGTVVGLYVSARTRGCRIEIINASQQVSELFSLTNLLCLFEGAGRQGGRMI
ncbi:MAG: STAS domain-containing protein [Candidatus Acidiferrum sp.]